VTIYAHDQKKSPLALIKESINKERRMVRTIHEANEIAVKRDADGLPERRKLNKYFEQKIEENGSRRKEFHQKDSKMFSKELVKRQLSGTRRKDEL